MGNLMKHNEQAEGQAMKQVLSRSKFSKAEEAGVIQDRGSEANWQRKGGEMGPIPKRVMEQKGVGVERNPAN